MKMITDPEKIRKDDPGHPEICSVFTIHSGCNNQREIISQECKEGSRGCVACKTELANVLYNSFSNFRERKKYYENRIGEVREIVEEGSKKARKIARETLEETVEAMKIKF